MSAIDYTSAESAYPLRYRSNARARFCYCTSIWTVEKSGTWSCTGQSSLTYKMTCHIRSYEDQALGGELSCFAHVDLLED